MAGPRFGSVNLLVDDVAAAAGFLEALGVRLEPTLPEWATHHRSFEADVPSFDADLDSRSFARWWGGITDEAGTQVVVNLRVERPEDVDDFHERALGLGATELKPPWDAFWGARYSVVLAPGPVCVGLMSPPEPGRRTAPPAIGDFT